MSEEISTGDEVHHLPSDEKWIVAFNENGRLSPCGWPESLAETKDCVLIKKATEKERIELEQRLLQLPPNDIRGSWARRNEQIKKHQILKERGYSFDNLKREWVKQDRHKKITIDEKFVKETLLGHFVIAIDEAG